MSKEFFGEETLRQLLVHVKNELSRYLKTDDLSVKAVQGEETSVTKTTTSNGVELIFAIPKGEKGDAYTLTEADKAEIESNVSAEIKDEINAALREIIAIQEELITHKSDAKEGVSE